MLSQFSSPDHPSFRRLPLKTPLAIASVLALALALSACGKRDETPSAGQQVDSAIAKTEQAATEAKAKAESSLAEAGAALKDTTQNVEAAGKDMASKAGAKIDDMAITTAIKAGLIQESGKQRHPLLRIASDPFFLIVVCSIMLGLTFNLLDFERPEVYAEINSWLIPTSSFLLLAAIGTQILIGRIPLYWKPALTISLLRMCLIPFCVLGFALLLGFGSGDVLTLKTIAIMGMMPMAFISLVPASLYNLDSDLISTAWIFTTGSLIVSVPLLSFLLA